MLALPGSAYLYQGEELGLPEVVDIPDVARRDPNWFRSNGSKYGRDGCRVPLPWQADSLSYGFGPHSKSWLPQPPAWRELAWDSQAADQSSTLHLYRRLLQLRKHYSLGTAELVWQDLGETAVAFHVRDILIIANTGSAPVAIPTADWTTILETAPIIDGAVQPNSTVWLTLKPPRLDAIKTS